MLFITPSTGAKAAKDYFARSLSTGDYYLRDAQEMPGQWHGLGAELLGLQGEVKQRDFYVLCDNLNPQTGERLTARTKDNRRVLYDFTFDAPKAVSLAYEVGGDERILDAFQASVRETMGEMEADMHARVRGKGIDADRRTANMIWAGFVHRTARPVDGVPDPQLHCHAVCFNATYDAQEQRWKAAQFGSLVRDKLYYQSAFHARLAQRLDALGYGVERDGNSFTLQGIGHDITAPFSRRTAVIEAEAARLGISDEQGKAKLGRRTREGKQVGQSMSELRAEWRGRLDAPALATLEQARRGRTASRDAREAVEYAVAHSFERASVVPERKLMAEALMQGVGRTGVDDAWREAERAQLLCRDVEGQRLATTRAVYREELEIAAFVRDGRGRHAHLGGSHAPSLDPQLSSEQRRAAKIILSSRDTVTGVRGAAGTGKTRLMQATVAAIEQTGKKVFTFAPSAKASRGVLREEGFANADTVERLLSDRKLGQQVQGQVLWIDEAGLLSTREMKRVFDLAKTTQCRVVLSGDTAQHSAVARGDALRLLQDEAGLACAELKTVRRQTSEEYREAVREISMGDARHRKRGTQLEAGIARLDQMGAIVETDGDARYRQLAADYAAATAERKADGSRKTALIVSPTHREGERSAAAVRRELKQSGRLGEKDREFASLAALNRTEAERASATSYRPGEVVRFHQNARGFGRGERVTVTEADGVGVNVTRADGRPAALPLSEAKKFQVYEAKALKLAAGDRLRITQNGFAAEKPGTETRSRLNNGDVFDVAGFTRQGDIRLGNGFVVPKDYGGIAQGYVVTSHASQGSTVDRALIALGRDSLVAANRQQFYVSVSRARESVRIYTDDKAALKEAVKSDASRLSATELLGAARRRPVRPDTLTRLTALQQVRRAYGAARERVRTMVAGPAKREEVRHARR